MPVTIFPFINKISGIWLFRFDSVINGYFGYMILGVLLGKVDTLKVKQRILIYLGGIAGILMAVFGTVYYSNSSAIDAFFNGGYQINSFLIAAAIFVFVRELFKRIENNKNSKSTASFLTAISFLGKCSFGVYLIHVLILELLCKYISYPSLPIQIICNFLICSAISFAGSALISKIPVLNKILLF